MMIRTQLMAMGLAIGLLVAPARSEVRPPPAATQVKATVHAASTLASGLVALTPSTGTAAAVAEEGAMLQYVAASGLGEIMGWGQDHFDAVDPVTVQAIVTNFQAAFKVLEAAFDGPGSALSFASLNQAAGKLNTHFTAIRTAVQAPAGDAAQQRREVHQLAVLFAHHISELPGSPLVENPKVGVQLALRTIRVGVAALDQGLAPFPQLAQQVAAELGALAALARNPPACAGSAPTAACLEQITGKALPLIEKIEKALK